MLAGNTGGEESVDVILGDRPIDDARHEDVADNRQIPGDLLLNRAKDLVGGADEDQGDEGEDQRGRKAGS